MSADETAVFFYGLFMDETLLESRGITPTRATVARLDGYALRIGERATLLPDPDSCAWGVLMTVRSDDVAALYADDSVADYRPEPVTVTDAGGARVAAVCYNLPADRLTGSNREYAQALRALAARIGLPESHLRQIADA